MKTKIIFLTVFGLAVCLQQTGYAESAGKNAVPKEQMTIARRFNAGSSPDQNRVPKGTAEKISAVQPSRRDSFSHRPGPGVKTPGYSRHVPPGQSARTYIPSAPIIGGPANPMPYKPAINGQSAKATVSTASLNGTGMKRKP